MDKDFYTRYGKNFCAAPFISLYEGENGMITTCCRSRTEIGNINKDLYEDVVNSNYMKNLRLQFLNNEKPTQCKNCWEYEDRTKLISSARSFNNEISQKNKNLEIILENIKDDGTIVNQMPVWLDLLSTNKCNFACLGCKPHLSSTIAKKYNREFQILHNNVDDYTKWKSEWNNNNKAKIDYILKYGHTIKEIHLNGGEPFLSSETYEMLDAMIDAGLNETITLWSHTNGSITKNYKGKDLVKDYFAKWKHAKITMSNDGVGIVGQFIRYGYTDKKWGKLFLKISDYPHIQLSAGCCLNIFNVFHLKTWTNRLLDLGKKINRNTLEWLDLKMWNDYSVSVRMLGICDQTKQNALDHIDQLLETNSSKKIILSDAWAEKLPLFKKVIETSTVPDIRHIRSFVLGIESLDKKRSVKFKDACPELISLYTKAKTFI